jgi:signal transduction histidine kinase
MTCFKVLEGLGINLETRFRMFKGRDIFERTRLRLTFLYSGILMLFLIVFIVVVYLLLYTTIFKDQERELITSAEQESRNIETYLRNQNQRNGLAFRNQQSIEKDVDQFFFYVVNRSGQLVLGDEQIPDFREEILAQIAGWNPQRNEILQKTFKINFTMRGHFGKTRGNEFRPMKRIDTIRLMIAGEPIFYNGDVIGMLYIGKEVSLAYQLFRWLLVILSGLALLFLGVAFVISHFMSKKAMVPISLAFSRQREFVADASHELRTPLSVMLSSINALEMTMEENKNELSGKLLGNLKGEVKRMTGLVSDLLTLARSDSGTVELKMERFDFRPIGDKVIESVSTLAEAKAIKLELDAQESLIIMGDAGRLTQLLYILLDNAVKYTPSGGKVKLTLLATPKQLWIQIDDSGIGITPEDYGRVFERFYRVNKARTRHEGGHGLGLAIAKWIVDSHKGTIQVTSELGKGSTFLIRIPNGE